MVVVVAAAEKRASSTRQQMMAMLQPVVVVLCILRADWQVGGASQAGIRAGSAGPRQARKRKQGRAD